MASQDEEIQRLMDRMADVVRRADDTIDRVAELTGLIAREAAARTIADANIITKTIPLAVEGHRSSCLSIRRRDLAIALLLAGGIGGGASTGIEAVVKVLLGG